MRPSTSLGSRTFAAGHIGPIASRSWGSRWPAGCVEPWRRLSNSLSAVATPRWAKPVAGWQASSEAGKPTTGSLATSLDWDNSIRRLPPMAESTSAPQPTGAEVDLGTDGAFATQALARTKNHPSLARRTDFAPTSRQEPYEVMLHVRICAGGRPQGRSLPRLIVLGIRSGIRSRYSAFVLGATRPRNDYEYHCAEYEYEYE